MSIFRKDQNEVHSMHGNHIAGVATHTSGASQVEMWHGRMDADSAMPIGGTVKLPDGEVMELPWRR